MAERTHRLARHLGGLLAPPDEGADADLLARFLADRDEGAFARLVRRHGPMVLGVCRRVLGDAHAADDAFQATFLVLARRAGSVRKQSSLGSWLYGVAYRTAQDARRDALRRRSKELRAAAMRTEAVPPDAPTDLPDLLDRELALLPEHYRAAVVACELEGLSRAEAARRLGWPEGTLSCRLARARSLLAGRLSKHGPTVAGTAFVGAAPVLSSALVASTARAAVLLAAGQSAAGVVPAAALELSHGVVKAMFVSKLKGVTAGLMVATAVAWTGSGGTWSTASAGPQEPPAGKAAKPGKAARDGEADRIAQLERERDALKRQLADALDRLVALEAQVREERTARERFDSALGFRDTYPSAAAPARPPQPAGAMPPGSSNPTASKSPGGTRPPGSAGGPTAGAGMPGMPQPALGAPLVLKAYRVADLAADEKQAEAVVRVIRSLVEPESWNGSGGAGVVEYLPAKHLLLVRQTPEVHQQVDALLRILLEQGDPPAKPTRSSPGTRP